MCAGKEQNKRSKIKGAFCFLFLHVFVPKLDCTFFMVQRGTKTNYLMLHVTATSTSFLFSLWALSTLLSFQCHLSIIAYCMLW